MAFTFYNPVRITFGSGKLNELGGICARYGKKALLVTTPNTEDVLRPLYDRVKAILAESGVTVFHFDEVVPNPVVQGIEKAIAMVKENGVELVVAVGGGSSMDSAKAISLLYSLEERPWNDLYSAYDSPFARYDPIGEGALPLICVPTTSGTGSEVTQCLVISDETTTDKMSIFHPDAFAKEAVVDPELTVSMPARLTAISGFDAFSHAFESYMRAEEGSYASVLAVNAMETIAAALPALVKDLGSLPLREKMSLAAMWAGISLSNAGAMAAHPLSELISGVCPRIAHGQALACLYPAFSAFQQTKTPGKCAKVAHILGGEDLPEAMAAFIRAIGLGQSLTELGVTPEEEAALTGHFLLGVLPFGTKDELTAIMRGAF